MEEGRGERKEFAGAKEIRDEKPNEIREKKEMKENFPSFLPFFASRRRRRSGRRRRKWMRIEEGGREKRRKERIC